LGRRVSLFLFLSFIFFSLVCYHVFLANGPIVCTQRRNSTTLTNKTSLLEESVQRLQSDLEKKNLELASAVSSVERIGTEKEVREVW
jgi:hypothetical protein